MSLQDGFKTLLINKVSLNLVAKTWSPSGLSFDERTARKPNTFTLFKHTNK